MKKKTTLLGPQQFPQATDPFFSTSVHLPLQQDFITISDLLLLPVLLLLLFLLPSGIDPAFTAWQHCAQGFHIPGPGVPQRPDEVAPAAAISQVRTLRLPVLAQCAEDLPVSGSRRCAPSVCSGHRTTVAAQLSHV